MGIYQLKKIHVQYPDFPSVLIRAIEVHTILWEQNFMLPHYNTVTH